jgi:hypothetical protein
MANFKDITGARFGNLVVTGYKLVTFPSGQRGSRWFCDCDCGGKTEVGLSNLRSGSTKSCGCLLTTHLKKLGISKRKCKTKEASTKFSWYKRNAKARLIEWQISSKLFEQLLTESCKYCGSIEKIGIDRVDVNLPYRIDNVAPCCTTCNQAKNNRSVSDFAAWVERVYTNLQVEKWGK